MSSTKNPNKQDQNELQQMAAFYKERFSEVWFLRCLECGRVIGVECLPADTRTAMVTDRGRGFYNYKDLTLSIRQRIDSHDTDKMIGYECKCGNSTIQAAVERGLVQEATVVVNKLTGKAKPIGEPIHSLSLFEQEQLAATIRINQAGKGNQADYEHNGNVERFESFQLERV